MGSMVNENTYSLKQTDAFLKKAFLAALFPSMLSILSGCINIIVDGILVGQKIGADGLAAINICLPVYLMMCIAGSFFVTGAAVNASQDIGRRCYENVQRYYSCAVGMCLVSLILFTVAGLFFSDNIAFLLCGENQAKKYVKEYVFVTLIGSAPKIVIYIPFNFLRIDGKNKSVTVMMMIMGIGNIILDILFMFIFNFGVAGAALASVVSTAAACIYGMIKLHSGTSSFKLSASFPDKEIFKKIAVAGSPAAVNNLMQTVKTICINSMLLSYGGSDMVAVFAVINGIAAFSEAVTLGVPQAGQAMLGVYYGEHDYQSSEILLKREFISGTVYSLIFSAAVICFSRPLGILYGMNESILIPLICLAVSMIPALWNNILVSNYNASNHNTTANFIIVSKTFVFAVLSLFIVVRLNAVAWIFIPSAELMTVIVWFVFVFSESKRKKNVSRFLLNPISDDDTGVLNFSVNGDETEICSASEKISDFCSENGMGQKQSMKISLAIEEILVLILTENKSQKVDFDIRVLSLQNETLIRIRYNGIEFDPLVMDEDDDRSMGVVMIKKMVGSITFNRVLGLNSLLIVI